MSQRISDVEKNIYNAIKEFSVDINCELNHYDGFSRTIWKKCCDYGLLAMLTPSKVGGLSEKYSQIIKVAKCMGYYIKDGGFVFAVNNSLIISAYLLPKFANEELIKECYPDLFNGEKIAAYAITESESGSNSFDMRTTFEEVENGFILNGTKTYISNASIADVVVVAAQKDNQISLFLVNKNDSGFKLQYEIPKMGLEACPMGQLSFDKCFVPKESLIGKIGSGMMISNKVLEWERICSFASHLGTMERIMEQCIKYANIRRGFSKSIGSNQLISEKIAKMKIDIELGNLLLEKIMDLLDKGHSAYLESSIFKYFIGEKYSNLCIEAMQIHGAYGYSKESKLEEEVRDALASKIYSGTSEIQLDIISRMIGIKK